MVKSDFLKLNSVATTDSPIHSVKEKAMLICQQYKLNQLVEQTQAIMARIYYNRTHFRVNTLPGFDEFLAQAQDSFKAGVQAVADDNFDSAATFLNRAQVHANKCLEMFRR